jgi:hypothetical protein
MDIWSLKARLLFKIAGGLLSKRRRAFRGKQMWKRGATVLHTSSSRKICFLWCKSGDFHFNRVGFGLFFVSLQQKTCYILNL